MTTESNRYQRTKVTNESVKEYKGGNETLDRLLSEHWPDETVWMVNGSKGRRPIVADTARGAVDEYDRRGKASTTEFLCASQQDVA